MIWGAWSAQIDLERLEFSAADDLDGDGVIDEMEMQVAREVQANTTVNCLLGDSKRNLESLEDNAYDFIYIDGAHDYSGVCGDAESARTKVKVGGIMAFNDYYIFEWGFLAKKGRWGVYGVVHAVNEFLIRYRSEWELIYYTFGPGGTDGGDLGLRRVR